MRQKEGAQRSGRGCLYEARGARQCKVIEGDIEGGARRVAGKQEGTGRTDGKDGERGGRG